MSADREPRLYRRVSTDLYAVFDPATGTFSKVPAVLVPPLVRADPARVRLSLAAARPHEDDPDEPGDDDDLDDDDDELTEEEWGQISYDPDTGEFRLF
ncbi:hypothetical protein [Gemmata sp.]|uniref:hypothetical protein n=1 Tax=Gemmata sp. TaxID=1914242 RepID=UPI003F71403B